MELEEKIIWNTKVLLESEDFVGNYCYHNFS